jgi:hypothetical protein
VISTLSGRLPARRHNRPLLVLVASTFLLALVGSVLSAFVLVRGVDEDTRRASAASIGQAVNTSFGSLTLDDVEHIPGLSDEDMGGAMPGMSGMVHAGSEQVVAYVTYRNTLRRSLDPAPDRFRLISATSDSPVWGTGEPQGTGMVQPGSVLQTSVRFVIPADESQLWLEYHDPNNGSTQRFAMGTAHSAPADGQSEHSH